MSIQDKAMLVSLTVRQWTARKYDKRVSHEVAKTHNGVFLMNVLVGKKVTCALDYLQDTNDKWPCLFNFMLRQNPYPSSDEMIGMMRDVCSKTDPAEIRAVRFLEKFVAYQKRRKEQR